MLDCSDIDFSISSSTISSLLRERESKMEPGNNAGCSATETERNIPMYESSLPYYLSSAYGVLKRIFSFLSLEDVDNAGEAFESWKAIAVITRKERQFIESFIISDHKYCMTKIWAEADFCICFSTTLNEDVDSEIMKYTTPTCHFCQFLVGAGIIGTVNDLSHLVQQKVRVGYSNSRRKYFFSVLRIPSMPNVRIKTYVWNESVDFAEFRRRFDVPPNETVKCVLIFMLSEGSVQQANMQKNDFINFLRTRQRDGFAIGGSVIDGFGNNVDITRPGTMIKYIVFYGDNVEAASIVLTADVKSLPAISSRVRILKDMCPDTKKGALFVFRCAGRQRIIRRGKLSVTNISKWEGESIRQYFPATPITGCFGYGEFGIEHPGYEEDYPRPKRQKKFNWEFSFSTSLVYIGFK